MRRQKRVALINDVTGFGRCSTAVQLPIISAMGVQCCILPTAILSAHTGYPTYYFDDYTRHMESYMNNWEELHVTFDGISTGFLGSKEQIEFVIAFIEKFRTDDTKIIIDPVMGDDGILYETYTEEMCEEMKRLVQYADVLTPNVTEACRLLDLDYFTFEITEQSLQEISEKLCEKGPNKVIVTGIQYKGQVLNYFYEQAGEKGLLGTKKVVDSRPGTGDIFSAVITGAEMLNMPLKEAVDLSAEFIHKGLLVTEAQKTPKNDGICFESVLGEFILDLKMRKEGKKNE